MSANLRVENPLLQYANEEIIHRDKCTESPNGFEVDGITCAGAVASVVNLW